MLIDVARGPCRSIDHLLVPGPAGAHDVLMTRMCPTDPGAFLQDTIEQKLTRAGAQGRSRRPSAHGLPQLLIRILARDHGVQAGHRLQAGAQFPLRGSGSPDPPTSLCGCQLVSAPGEKDCGSQRAVRGETFTPSGAFPTKRINSRRRRKGCLPTDPSPHHCAHHPADGFALRARHRAEHTQVSQCRCPFTSHRHACASEKGFVHPSLVRPDTSHPGSSTSSQRLWHLLWAIPDHAASPGHGGMRGTGGLLQPSSARGDRDHTLYIHGTPWGMPRWLSIHLGTAFSSPGISREGMLREARRGFGTWR